MKTMGVLVSVVLMLFTIGCVPTTKDIEFLNNDIDVLMEKVDEYQTAAESVKDKVFEEVDRIQDQVIIVNDAMKGQDGTIEKLIAGNEASALFNPYAPIIDVVLKGFLGLTTVGGATGIGLGIRSANKAKAKRRDEKAGKEKALKILTEMPDEEITSAKVDKIMFDCIGEARARNGTG